MSNLTIEECLLKEHTPDPLEGHDVVVFERVGSGGERIHTVLRPGSVLQRKGSFPNLFRAAPEYFAYAVDASPERHLGFAQHVSMADHAHEVDVVFDLGYAAADPRLVASERNKDPLGRVRRYAQELVARDVAELEWERVWRSFREAGEEIGRRHLASLNAFAAPYGIAVRTLGLSVTLSEEDTLVAREWVLNEYERQRVRMTTAVAKERIDADEELSAAEREKLDRLLTLDGKLRLGSYALEQAAHSAKANLEMQDALAQAAREAVLRIGRDISTPQDLASAIQLVQALAARSGPGGMPGDQGVLGSSGGSVHNLLARSFDDGYAADQSPFEGSIHAGSVHGGSVHVGTAPAGQPPVGSLAHVLSQVVAATQPVRLRSQRQRLRGALLHLVAAVVETDGEDEAALGTHAARVRDAMAALDPQPSGEDRVRLDAFCDAGHVRDMLAD